MKKTTITELEEIFKDELLECNLIDYNQYKIVNWIYSNTFEVLDKNLQVIFVTKNLSEAKKYIDSL